MFTTYEEAVSWIHSRLRLGVKPGLKRMEWMMEKLEHPERRVKAVHIGGTNGKGSTVTYLRSILQEAGYEVGTFTSPYFELFNERISINGVPVSDEDIVRLANDIYPLSLELEETELGGPTEFEIITAMAFQYFGRVNPVDIVLYEVGLGGRFDSTNVILPILSIITNIGLDHTGILGDTHAEIAFEKAGIIKPGISVITAVKQKEALEVILEKAAEMKAPVYSLGNQIVIKDHKSSQTGEVFTQKTPFKEWDNLEISMAGTHQTENAALAVMAAEVLNKFYSFLIEDKHLYSGLKKAYWPGRFEMMSKDPVIVIDGAHNEEGVAALVSELKKRFSDKKINLIFTALADKKLDKMIGNLDAIADKITFVEFDYPRAAKAKALFELSGNKNKHFNPDWKKEIEENVSTLEENDILVITGSLYFLSEMKPFLAEKVEK
ncbi:folylpolyglutamate synthase/dihydrofolate synthase family protein [Bacillus sp. DTU_2020_1000418_1_SI_GHA_SEK_038]|uniref:bifunctional folylpolyglutamate synthase/dihydrofolate synthase n=1 Tax=Bacillus sp. DTU_2020_1000418_1_SI_GHA_SEK_038 TaxID=3077585 RepID=UPI0028E9AA20|nr:folylpolyglutamate synthase/dihydrofolate synthase family protein [Bacillus sp. DTU_2020_1000418_1_SI_GHA_SEK_038]WNS74475.1 folylpolyglutamate synthase/dihydrofolate synthase family protein [Bacillus sp. DTU_2020_1000418_1_SI_GHA_SEK_038]